MIAASATGAVCYFRGVGRSPHSERKALGSRLAAWLPWLGLFAAAVLLRAVRFGSVLHDGELKTLFAADEFYHLRRIWFTVVNFPASLDFDFYMNHPLGAQPIWPPFFDWSIAALARVLVGAEDQGAVEVVAAWVPPLLGGLAVLASVALVRRVHSAAAGWVSGALLAALPAHIAFSQLGEVDHHVAVGLLATCLIASAATLAAAGATASRPAALRAGALAGAAILLWPGALLHVLVVEAFLIAQLLAEPARAGAVARARSLALMHAAAAALLLPFCVGVHWPQFGDYSPQVLSRFQPLWLGAVAASLAAASTAWARSRIGETRRQRLGSGLLIAALGAGAIWIGVPALAASVGEAAGWFAADSFLRVVAETKPLLFPEGAGFAPQQATKQFTWLFWIHPIALCVLAWGAYRRGRADALLVWMASGVAFAAVLVQLRFRDVAALGFAWVMGPALLETARALGRTVRAPRPVWVGVLVLMILAAAFPSLQHSLGELHTSFAARRGSPPERQGEIWLRLALRELGRWARSNTPHTEGYLDPTRRPEYGMLSAWGHGHVLRYYAERPMVQDNFGPWGGREGSEAALRYYASEEESEAAALAEQLGARYVVATIRGSGQENPQPHSMASRLVPVRRPDGTLVGRGQPLERHRLLYVAEDGGRRSEGGNALLAPALYEIVAGARVRGTAPAGVDQVGFEGMLTLPVRERFHYHASAPVAPDGSYEIRLPVPSEAGYQVNAGGQVALLRISERDVQLGRLVSGPHFE
jgi:asparagine N-glycosylation enzyme membrane subunit Stt3